MKLDKSDISIGEPPPPGLTPVGDWGLYATPDEPADPTDCDRYPDSPFCGGNPFSVTPIGIEPEFTIDPCGATVTATPIVAFIKLPPLNVSYRLPGECRNEYEKQRDGKEPKFDIPDGEAFGCADLNLFDVDDAKVVYAFISSRYAATQAPSKICDAGFVTSTYEYVHKSSEFKCPGDPVTIAGIVRSTEVSCTSHRETVASNIPTDFDRNRNCFRKPSGGEASGTGTYMSRSYFTPDDRTELYITADGRIAYSYYVRGNYREEFNMNLPKPWYRIDSNSTDSSSYTAIYKGPWGLLKAYLAIPANIQEYAGYAGFSYPKFYQPTCYAVIEVGCKNVPPTFNYQLPPPPPPPPKKKECCVSCCSPSQQNDTDYMPILQKILKEAETINKSVGVFPTKVNLYDSDENKRGAQGKEEELKDIAAAIKLLTDRIEVGLKIAGIAEYPVSVPSSFISKDEGFIGNLIPNFNMQVYNQTTLMGWYVERFDEIMGQWEIPIEIKDSDPSQAGDQPRGVKLPNLAEAIAELFGMIFQISINSEVLVNMSARTLTEAGLTRQQAFINYSYSQAIANHLAFEFREKSYKVPFMFTPGKETLDEFLKAGELDVIGIEHSDKLDLKANLSDLLQSAAIIRAVFWRKLDPNADMKKQMVDLIKNQSDSSKQIQDPKSEDGKTDFDSFIEKVEIGFTNETGVTDPNKPYGRDYSERPRIRRLGTDQDAVDEGQS